MSLVYRIMYRVGLTPWDTGEVPSELRAVVEGDDALDAGSALDVGCGTGTQSLYLGAHGWRATGVDDLEQPLRRARARSAAAGVAVDWVAHESVALALIASNRNGSSQVTIKIPRLRRGH